MSSTEDQDQSVQRAAAFDEITEIGDELLALSADHAGWDPERAAELYEQRARVWIALVELVPHRDPVLTTAVHLSAAYDARRADELAAHAITPLDTPRRTRRRPTLRGAA